MFAKKTFISCLHLVSSYLFTLKRSPAKQPPDAGNDIKLKFKYFKTISVVANEMCNFEECRPSFDKSSSVEQGNIGPDNDGICSESLNSCNFLPTSNLIGSSRRVERELFKAHSQKPPGFAADQRGGKSN